MGTQEYGEQGNREKVYRKKEAPKDEKGLGFGEASPKFRAKVALKSEIRTILQAHPQSNCARAERQLQIITSGSLHR